jgi:2,3-dihydroxybiphenyl 1,2-dioxygenase
MAQLLCRWGIAVFDGLTLAYIGIEVPEPGSLDQLFGEVVGLVAGPATATGGSTWRNDDRIQRVLVEAGPAKDATVLGFEASDATSFAEIVSRLRSAGFDVEEGLDSLAEARHVSTLARATAPWGAGVELVLDLAAAEDFASPLVPGGFLTDGMGMGHAVFATTNFDQSHRFVTDGLGMRQSDWLEMEIAQGIELEVRFYHCNPRHHTIALAKAPFELPQALHHIMFEAREVDDVGAAFDRARASGLSIANALGKHDNDEMFSFYAVSPAGFQVEVGHGARVVTDTWDGNHRYDRMSRWGHQPLEPTAN